MITLAQQFNLNLYFITEDKSFGNSSGGWIEGLLDSAPKSNCECVLKESWFESLLQFELGLLFFENVFLYVY